MAKGFMITPVLFVGLFLITGLMFLNFAQLDKQMAEGISKESRANKVATEYREAEASRSTLLFLYIINATIDLSIIPKNINTISASVQAKMGSGSVIIPACDTSWILARHTDQFHRKIIDANITRPISVERNISCADISYFTGQSASIDCLDGNTFSCP